jgi:hypothetical protein
MPGNPFGTYGAGQQIRKLAFFQTTTTGGNLSSAKINSPYGSTAGFMVFSGSANFSAGTLQARCLDSSITTIVSSLTLPAAAQGVMPVAPTSCTLIDVRCALCANAGGTISVFYFFYPPGAAAPSTAQPASTKNSEATSAANTAVSITLTVTPIQRGHLFNVNARCSAGTAQLTVADGATQIWSSAATEVGTTSFTKAWNPGLASSGGNNLVITLGTCGGANTGTLDVQGSVF